MQPDDQALLGLADPTARAGVLGSDALLAIAQVCYDFDPGTVVGAATAVYDQFDLAVTTTVDVLAAARWSRATDPSPVEASATVTGLIAPAPGADAVWSGSVVLRTAGGSGTITSAEVTLPDLDAAIAAAVAGLPPNSTPDALVAAQRGAARTALANPALTDTELDAVLAGAGAGTIPELGLEVGGRDPVSVKLSFSAIPPATNATAPVAVPVVVAFLVADGASPRALLQQTEAARRAAARYPARQPPASGPPRMRDRCVCWVVPATAFDDAGWPGGGNGTAAQQRANRLAAARTWLRDQGIAVVTT